MNQWKLFNLHKNQAVNIQWGSRTDREEYTDSGKVPPIDGKTLMR